MLKSTSSPSATALVLCVGERGDMLYFDLIDDNEHYFTVGEENGEIRVEQSLEADVKHVLFCFARDQAQPEFEVSTSAVVRIDTFSDWKFLIDVHLSITRQDYEARADAFYSALAEVIKPWVLRVYKVRDQGQKLKEVTRRRLLQAFEEEEDGE